MSETSPGSSRVTGHSGQDDYRRDYAGGSSLERGSGYEDYGDDPRRFRGGASYRGRIDNRRDHDWSDMARADTATAMVLGAGLGLLAGWFLFGAARSGQATSWSGGYASSNAQDVAALEALTSTLTDSINGYEEAAEVASNSGISAFFREKAQERRAVVSEFRNRIGALGGDRDVRGSVTAALHRRFLDLRSMFQNDTKAAIAEVKRGEGYLTERFETYMADQSLSAATRNLIRSTYQRVRFDHARREQLKQSQS
jgi:uncharacterized protein (TIGR02284 family)